MRGFLWGLNMTEIEKINRKEQNEKSAKAAEQYASLGWRVIPLHGLDSAGCSCGKFVCPTPGKHPVPTGWTTIATSDLDKVREMDWSGNIGIVPGKESGFFVVDIDPRNGGDDTLEIIEHDNGVLPSTVEQITGGGGRHLLFKYPSDCKITNGKLGSGIDIKSDNGMMVAEPSLHTSGRQYEWEASSRPEETEIAAAPQWLLKLLAKETEPVESNQPQLVVPTIVTEEEKAVAINSASAYLNSCEPAIEGESGGLRTFKIAGRLKAFGLDVDTVCQLIVDSDWNRGCSPPWSDDSELRDKVSRSRPWVSKKDAKVAQPIIAPMTEIENANVFVERYGNDCRYVLEWRKWIYWDGRRWAIDLDGARTFRAVKRFVSRDLAKLSEAIKDDDKRQTFFKWVARCQTKNHIENVIGIAAKSHAINAAMLDQQPMLLNVQNGTLDLETYELRPHVREDLLTKISPINFDPTAICPTWDKFLARIFQHDDGTPRGALLKYVQASAAYSMTADISEQCFFILHGNGKNGKTTFIEAIKYALGDYASTPLESVVMKLDRKTSTNSDDEAALFGVRFAACSETNEGQRFDESKVKRLTGNETITAMRKYEQPFTFPATWKIWLDCNHLPKINGTDLGIWRRIRAIPFTATISEAERDMGLAVKLRSEAAGVLNWLILGLKNWRLAGGLGNPPQDVLDAVKSYRSENDILGQFLSENTVESPIGRVSTKSLYNLYSAWADNNGLDHKLTAIAFGRKLSQRGYTIRDSNSVRYAEGLELIAFYTNASNDSDGSAEATNGKTDCGF